MVCPDTDSTSTLCPRDLIVSAICNRVSGANQRYFLDISQWKYTFMCTYTLPLLLMSFEKKKKGNRVNI